MKRTPEEEQVFSRLLRIEAKKGHVSLSSVTADLRDRNLKMAAYLASRGVKLPDYYAEVSLHRK